MYFENSPKPMMTRPGACCPGFGGQWRTGGLTVVARSTESLPFPTVVLVGNHYDRDSFLREFGGQSHNQNGFVLSEFAK